MSDPVLMHSDLLERAGFVHGFFTRLGGVSQGALASLNLSFTQGDEARNVERNRELVRTSLDAQTLLLVGQVHGTRVIVIADQQQTRSISEQPPEADALVCSVPGVAIGVLTADCVPILLADPCSGAVAAIHAGWRGTFDDAPGAAVRSLCDEFGAKPGQILAALGPSIGPASYAVSPDLARQFIGRFGSNVVDHGTAPRLDLWRANVLNLCRAGLDPQRIKVLAEDSFAQPERFFSHRRDPNTGRQGSFILPRR
ncbi:MAG: peptidoglycan editing factor PgeF [Candidatus Alcyoniella australis]|nr:peptidoglycan editing factor PgeF [Candidatus Alcyoniella australis]